MTKIQPLPIKLTLAESPFTKRLTQTQILEGLCTRTLIDSNNLTVASFGSNFVLHKPDWLYSIISKHNSNKGDEVNALLRFGDGESNISVKIRNSSQGNNSGSSAAKKKEQQATSISLMFSAFLEEGGQPAILNPKDNLYKIIQGCNLETGVPQLYICPNQLWDDKRNKNDSTTTKETSITLIVKKNQLYQTLYNNEKEIFSDDETSTPQNTKKRKSKDPNAPKAKTSAYTYFLMEESQKIQDANPGKTFAEYSKLTAKKWKNLNEEEKQKYTDLAKKDKARFEEEHAKYVPSGEEHEKKKKKKDPNYPKGARNIYWFFCNEERPRLSNGKDGATISLSESSALLSKKYKEMSDQDKEKYQKMADDDRKRFEQEKKLYDEGKFVANVDKDNSEEKAAPDKDKIITVEDEPEKCGEEILVDEEVTKEKDDNITDKNDAKEKSDDNKVVETPSKTRSRSSKRKTTSSNGSVKSSSKKKKKSSRRKSSHRRKSRGTV